jgi:NADH:ubiquinone oxidoreductase subunit 5 (subunit L)/multisubunit Na+/H+ antiporter MnhA subunit
MFSIVLILPFISTITILFFGAYIGTVGSMFISCVNLVFALVASIIGLYFESLHASSYVDLWTWMNLNNLPIEFNLRYDSLTAIMFIVVTLISSLVHIYSCVYMYTDPFLSRFLAYLSLFTFFMLLLVSSGNILVLFVGWEGVGLCSYLLIGFWHTRAQAGKAATKAFIINKIGDLFLLIGISLIFIVFHSLDFSVISVLIPFCPTNIVEAISIFLFLGAVGKSAQIGLHT